MDKPLRWVTVFGLLLIFALMVQVNYIQGSQAEKLQTHDLNNRQFLDVFKRPRGKILAGGEVLVSSTKPKESENYARTYKNGEVFAPVTGYFNGGANGIERAYNSLLDGRDKRITNQRWFDQFIGKKALGADVETTIMPAAQRRAYEELRRANPNLRGAVVVMDIRTGAIVVMATYPSYDPTDVAPQTGLKGGERLVELEGKPNSKGEVNERNKRLKPLINNVLEDTFSPGSSFKALIAASALENGYSKDSAVPAPSTYLLPGTRTSLPNSHEGGACGGAGTAPLISTFAESCNTTYGILGAQELGTAKVLETAKEFHYDQRIKVEPDLSSVQSAFPDADGARTALASIGQGDNNATPLHIMMIAAAAANDGRIMKPYLVQRVRAADQSVLEEADPQQLAEPLSGGQADQLADMMRAVTSTGTAKGVGDVAGKTGTADIDGVEYNNRWFAGFAPAQNPRYAFAVFTQGIGSGGEAAAPIAVNVMREVLKK
ncbi:cell elongation-specific peptidoglycan D,D-transpeptidase [Thermomonospora echinospora]|uniref:Cell elongation-specific peptidoglycan D,D-transpeptidase n=2 Tax=Thermomonospora echinospora TaxID=1992 RepID=A0A1H6CSB4_9ACTN|nr:cell elongation-specific peptidoglycan D,D-transpeptidase [Thermomonospora echinospora]